jgi:hypothetical protein
MAAFAKYVGIDYSGTQTPSANLNGLRVYLAEGNPTLGGVSPPPSLRTCWMRRGIGEWLVNTLAEDVSSLVGIDHDFSIHLHYFETRSRR